MRAKQWRTSPRRVTDAWTWKSTAVFFSAQCARVEDSDFVQPLVGLRRRRLYTNIRVLYIRVYLSESITRGPSISAHVRYVYARYIVTTVTALYNRYWGVPRRKCRCVHVWHETGPSKTRRRIVIILYTLLFPPPLPRKKRQLVHAIYVFSHFPFVFFLPSRKALSGGI